MGTPRTLSVRTTHRRYFGLSSVLKPIVSTLAHRRDSGLSSLLQPTVSAPAHRRYFGLSSMLQPIVSAQAHRQCLAHWQCSGALAVLQRLVGAPAYRRYPQPMHNPWSVPRQQTPNTGAQHHASIGHHTANHQRRRPDAPHATRCPSPHRVPTDQPRPEEHCAPGHRSCPRTPSVLWRIVGAPASRRCSSPSSAFWRMVRVPGIASAPAHGRYPGHCPCPGALSVLTAHRRCSGAWSIPGAWSVLRLMVGAHTENRGQAPSTTLDSAQQGRAADWEQRPLLRRSRSSQRLTPGVRCQRHRACCM
jgi:hypothetical protein